MLTTFGWIGFGIKQFEIDIESESDSSTHNPYFYDSGKMRVGVERYCEKQRKKQK